MTRLTLIATALLASLPITLHAAQFDVQQDEDGVTVNLDGELFTRYIKKSGAKPILWPIIGPTGKEMTRAYPMTEGPPTERKDHVHHRSFFFTHGNVNGVDFWSEGAGHGNTEHREFVKVQGGNEAVIVTRNDWVSGDGRKQCEDLRTLTFGADGDSRWIDFEITIKAGEQTVKFGDTKEGTFGIRVAGTLDVDAKKGGKIVNSEGLTDGAAWGKPASWVDYHGPIDGETLGIAVLNHPSSFRYPTHWHVRTYGLFAANPFGLKDFKAADDGSHTLNPGETMTLRYRVLLHKGNEKEGKVADAFEAYAKQANDGD